VSKLILLIVPREPCVSAVDGLVPCGDDGLGFAWSWRPGQDVGSCSPGRYSLIGVTGERYTLGACSLWDWALIC
jgi:hypothetical protein